jgi:type IV secretion system protein VirB3
MEQETMDLSMVFKALSKPATLMGVDYDYFLISGLVVMLVFITSDSFLAFLLFFPLHIAGWILCRIDPHIFRLLSVRASIGSVKNHSLWNCQSYEAF